MTTSEQTDYFIDRERHERALADTVTDPIVAAIHRDMADRYARLISVPGAAAEDA